MPLTMMLWSSNTQQKKLVVSAVRKLSPASSSPATTTTTACRTATGISRRCFVSSTKNTRKRFLSSPASAMIRPGGQSKTTLTTTTKFLNNSNNPLQQQQEVSSIFTTFQQAAAASATSNTTAAAAAVAAAKDKIPPQLLPILGHVGYLCLASGFLMTDMLQLRVLLVGGYTGLVAFHSCHARPLKIPLGWSAVFVLVNAGAACCLIADRYAAPLEGHDEALYQDHFAGFLTRGQFHQLLSLGQRQYLPEGTILTEENTACPSLYFLESGQTRVHHGSSVVATIETGGFVNDVAFSRGGGSVGAYGTVVTSRDCSVIVWDTQELREHLKSRPEMERNMKFCLSDHLVKSLLRQREAAHLRQQQLLLPSQ